MKKSLVRALICIAVLQVASAKEGDSPKTFLRESVSITSNAMFEIVAGPTGKASKTATIGMYPPSFSKHGAFNGVGYMQTFRIRIKEKEANPRHSKSDGRILTHIGGRFMQHFGVRWRNITDSSMTKAVGAGYVRLFQGKRIALTLMMVPTDKEDVYIVCGTFAEVNSATPQQVK